MNWKRKITFLLIITFAGYLGMYRSTYRPLNVLLIQADALRPDHLGCYGYERDTSPNIDALAKRGILFTQAIAQSPWTTSSIGSLLTSTYEYTHGAEKVGSLLGLYNTTLPEILKKKGYVTGAVIVNPNLSPTSGFNQGFGIYDYLLKDGETNPIDIKKYNAAEVTNRAVEWLKRYKNKKFFLWLFYFDTHGPYLPPHPFDKIYLNDKFYRGTKHVKLYNAEERTTIDDNRYKYKSLDDIPVYQHEVVNLTNYKTDVDYYIAQYDGEIRFLDKEIGRLLTELEALGLNKNTIIILTADHAESLGENNNYFTHGGTLYDSVIKIPLIIRVPHLSARNTIVNCQVQTMDIAPTILDMLKVNKDKRMQGKSLLPVILGEKKIPHDYIISTYKDLTGPRSILASIRTSNWKLICTVLNNKKRIYEWYDLKKDPTESNNIIEKAKYNAEAFSFLKRELDRYISNIPLNTNTTDKVILEPEMKKRLKSLGYLE